MFTGKRTVRSSRKPAHQAATETSKVLVETEKLLLDAAAQKKFPAVILRVAGIYGPERGHLFLQYLKNEAKIEGKGERFINMIHRDDLVGFIIAALKNGRPGEIYNAVDDEPVAQIHFFRWLSETLGKWMPPFAAETENAERKRGLTNKKLQNRKLKMELGYQFKYPTFRQGYTAEIQRLDDAGLLNIDEPRDRRAPTCLPAGVLPLQFELIQTTHGCKINHRFSRRGQNGHGARQRFRQRRNRHRQTNHRQRSRRRRRRSPKKSARRPPRSIRTW